MRYPDSFIPKFPAILLHFHQFRQWFLFYWSQIGILDGKLGAPGDDGINLHLRRLGIEANQQFEKLAFVIEVLRRTTKNNTIKILFLVWLGRRSSLCRMELIRRKKMMKPDLWTPNLSNRCSQVTNLPIVKVDRLESSSACKVQNRGFSGLGSTLEHIPWNESANISCR